jgi:hypothetical protein
MSIDSKISMGWEAQTSTHIDVEIGMMHPM